jgi:isopenicillin-N epimerase
VHADEFLLDPNVVFLNHGSFGACPRPVFECYQTLQRELEREPIEFLDRRLPELLAEARAALAAYVGAGPDDLVFVPNATSAVNAAARSLELGADDEVLSTNLEYGANDLLFEHLPARYVRAHVPLPLPPDDELVDLLFQRASERTRVIFVSHVTSETAVILPVRAICERARSLGILTLIDGAHTPGHVPLDLEALGADGYAGNCHKWLGAPKGAGFLHVHADLQERVQPLITGWGFGPDGTYLTRHERQGTRDPSAYLSVPAAIEWQTANDSRAAGHALAVDAQRRLSELTGLAPLSDPERIGRMVSVHVPLSDPESVQRRLHDDYRIEVPIFARKSEPLLRASFGPYNDESDLESLLTALERVLSDS